MALVMIADDAPDIIVLLTDVLKSRGHQVVSVTDGVQMVEKAKEWLPHIIIADLMMPGAYGSAAYKTLLQEPKTAGIPVIFLTAAMKEQAERVIPQSPKVRILYKPLVVPSLMKAIEELLPKPA